MLILKAAHKLFDHSGLPDFEVAFNDMFTRLFDEPKIER
jgi:hypothetical protein